MPLKKVKELKSDHAFKDFHASDYLIIACSDPRFRIHLNNFEEFLQGEVDRIIVPGGPLVYCGHNYGLADTKDAVLGWTELLANHHKVREIILMSHAGCAAYAKALLTAGKNTEDMYDCQQNDLILVHQYLQEKLPTVIIRKLIAAPSNGEVFFTEYE